jgi:hypothetical protein
MNNSCLAAQEQHHLILQFCLDQGAVFDRYLNRAGRLGARTTEMLELLYGENWFDIQNSAEAVQEQIGFFREDSLTGRWLRKHAAKAPVEPTTTSSEEEDGNKGSRTRGKGQRKRKGQGRGVYERHR